MATNSFNLIDEKWIPTVDKGFVSLKQVFSDREIKQLGGSVIEKLSIFKLLLAIAQSAYTPKDDLDWRNYSKKNFVSKVNSYLDKWHDNFFLYSDENPFLQFPILSSFKTELKYSPQRGDVSFLTVTSEISSSYSPQRGDVSIESSFQSEGRVYSPQRGDVSGLGVIMGAFATYSPQRGDVSDYVQATERYSMYSPQRGDVSQVISLSMAKGAYSPQRGDVSSSVRLTEDTPKYSPQRGDVSRTSCFLLRKASYSPHRGDVSFPKIKFIVAPVSSTQ